MEHRFGSSNITLIVLEGFNPNNYDMGFYETD